MLRHCKSQRLDTLVRLEYASVGCACVGCACEGGACEGGACEGGACVDGACVRVEGVEGVEGGRR